MVQPNVCKGELFQLQRFKLLETFLSRKNSFLYPPRHDFTERGKGNEGTVGDNVICFLDKLTWENMCHAH